jgi:hypothetical protein
MTAKFLHEISDALFCLVLVYVVNCFHRTTPSPTATTTTIATNATTPTPIPTPHHLINLTVN